MYLNSHCITCKKAVPIIFSNEILTESICITNRRLKMLSRSKKSQRPSTFLTWSLFRQEQMHASRYPAILWTSQFIKYYLFLLLSENILYRVCACMSVHYRALTVHCRVCTSRVVHRTVYHIVLEARRDEYGCKPYRTVMPYQHVVSCLSQLLWVCD